MTSLPVTRTYLGMYSESISILLINVLLPFALLAVSVWIFILSAKREKTNWLAFIFSAISVSLIAFTFFVLGNPETAAYLIAIAMLLTGFGMILSSRKS